MLPHPLMKLQPLSGIGSVGLPKQNDVWYPSRVNQLWVKTLALTNAQAVSAATKPCLIVYMQGTCMGGLISAGHWEHTLYIPCVKY